MLTINITGEVDMNILQVQDALKNASDMQLSGELQNPTGLAPSYLVLSEMKRRQQMRQGAMASPAPQSSMAEEAASQAQPEYYPEEQPQEEEAGIEAFREGGVVRMAEGGGLPVFRPMPSGLPRSTSPRLLDAAAAELSLDPSLRTPAMIDNVARQYGIEPSALAERLGVAPPFSPEQPAATPAPAQRPAAPASTESTPPAERAASEPYGPPAPPPGQPRQAPSPTRAGAGINAVAAQPSGQTTDPTIQALYDRPRATGQSREDYRKDAVNTGLMQAGLAMMASKDPNALANLGQGGLRGLESYTQEMRQGRLGERQGIQDEITIRRAQTEEAYRRGIITNQERQLRLSELRLGEAAGDRAERRAERVAAREEQNELASAQSLQRALPDYTRRIAGLNEQIRETTDRTERQGLIDQRARLEAQADEIRRLLALRGGANPTLFETPAPTQGSGRPPPGQIRQPNLWPAPQ